MPLISPIKTKKTITFTDCGAVSAGESGLDAKMPDWISPGGWVLLRGSLIRRGGDYNARLYYDLGNGFAGDRHFDIPTSAKGAINELICLPAGIRNMRFSPMDKDGEIQVSELSVTKIGIVERVWRMTRRVVTMIFLHSRKKRKVIGLEFFRMLFDLQGSYIAASKLRAYAPAPEYPDWIIRFDSLGSVDRRKIDEQIAHFMPQPHFDLLLVSDSATQGAVQNSLRSLSDQIYRNFTCTVLETGDSAPDLPDRPNEPGQDAAFIASGLAAKWLAQFNENLVRFHDGKWLVILQAGDVLAPHALYRFACEALSSQTAVMLYSDDDALDANGQRCQPRFKPDWSMAHLRATNFVGNAVALRGIDVAKAGGVDMGCCRHGNLDLLLRVLDATGAADAGKVDHIPAVLLHRAGEGREDSAISEWNRHALQAHLARNGVVGEVSATQPGCWRVRYGLPDVPPLVSIIVPTRNELELIRQCIESLLEKTTYPRFEILVVDNQSTEPEVLAYLARIAGYERVRVLHYDQPFNYSAMNNTAVQAARGEVLCLLNNDTEVISPDWLEEMVGNLLQPKVGVVGAKLLFPDGRVQHGGDLVGVGGVANHAQAYLQRTDPGYCNRAVVAQDLSAVTAACLATWRNLYQELGGLDEQHLKVAFNDVDYCLRVREAGYRVVWTPHAELYHHESVSRGKDSTPVKKRRAQREVAYMRRRWKQVMNRDPFYNPNLSQERPDFSLSHAPVVEKPWLK